MGLKNNEPCMLQITSSTVLLILESSVPISWPFNCIRRYKCHPGSFLLEVGRKAATGEGVFRFFTQEGQDIFEILGKSVSERMSSKQESKTDLASSFAALSTPSNDSQSSGPLNIMGSKQNPFMDITGGGDGIRFVMKKRSTSSPPPSPKEISRSPPTIEDTGRSYSHLKFVHEKPVSGQDPTDYEQLARAKQCSRFNKTRMSESCRSGAASSSKALKVLGLIRSNSAENLQRSGSVNGSSESSNNMYSRLEFEGQSPKKSHSSSNILEESASGRKVFESNLVRQNSEKSDEDSLYNKLHTDLGKKIAAFHHDSTTYNVLSQASSGDSSVIQNDQDDTYDKLGGNQGAAIHRGNRPEPILITDENYDALRFSSDKKNLDESKREQVPKEYEVPWSSQHSPSPRSPEEVQKPNLAGRAPIAKPTPAGGKPAIGKKPMPVKPPRKPNVGDVNANTDIQRDAQQTEIKSVGNGARENLISQLKKNFESQDSTQPKTPASPLSPPNSSKKLVEPFYAVSPFGGGNKSQFALSSEYDVPTNNAPRFPVPSETKQSMGFIYAVSPFHSGSQKAASELDQNLYDTPNPMAAVPASSFAPTNAYDTPTPRPAYNNDANLYDTPSQVNAVRNAAPFPMAARAPFQAPNKNIQFTYAVSPFAGGQSSSNQIDFSCHQEEAAYCEVSEVRDGDMRIPGYVPVGGVVTSCRQDQEAIYANPRD